MPLTEEQKARLAQLEAEKAAAEGSASVTGVQAQFTPLTPEQDARLTPEQKARLAQLEAEKAAVGPSGIRLSGDASSNDYRPGGFLPEALTPTRFTSKYQPELEGFPDVWLAPAVRSLAGATAAFTNTDANEVEKILKANNPGTTVETRGGYKLYKFPNDDQVYAWKPGIRPSDLARAVPGTALALLTGGGSLPVMAGVGAATALAGELAQGAVGGSVDAIPVALAAGAPAVVPAVQVVGQGVASAVRGMTKIAGQTAEDVAGPLMDRIRQLATSWGANPDASALGQKFASITQPVVDRAENVLATTTAAREATTAAATAKAEAEALATAKTAKDATLAARAQAEDAAVAARNRVQDATAAAAVQEETARKAAEAPGTSVLDKARQLVVNWGASESSTLDKRFMDQARGVLKDATMKAEIVYDKIKKAVPATTRILADQPELKALLTWVDEQLAGQNPKLQSAMLNQIKSVMTPQMHGNAIKFPTFADAVELRKLASAAGKSGSFASEVGGRGKEAAGLLRDVEHRVAADAGFEELVNEGKKLVSDRKVYESALKEALSLKSARALNATMLPARDAASKAMQKGNVEELRQLMAATPKGMKQEVMASTVQNALLEGMPSDLKGALEHTAKFVETMRNRREIGDFVFSELPPGSWRNLLSVGTEAKSALKSMSTAELAAKSEREAAELAARRAATQELLDIRRGKNVVLEAAREQKAGALRTIQSDKDAAIGAAAKNEATAKTTLESARAVNIPLATEARTAGVALAKGDTKPFDSMMKAVSGTAPEMKKEVAASTLYHSMVDPADDLAAGLKRAAGYMSRLKANPEARKRLLSHLPGVETGLDDLTDLTRIVSRGTKEGTKKAEDFLGNLAAMGAWVGGKTGIQVGGSIGGAITGGTLGGPIGAAGGFILGRMIFSKIGRDATARTKAADAFLASTPGRELLARLSLDKPITPNALQKLGQTQVFQRLMTALEVPLTERGLWLERAIRGGGKTAITPSSPNEEK